MRHSMKSPVYSVQARVFRQPILRNQRPDCLLGKRRCPVKDAFQIPVNIFNENAHFFPIRKFRPVSVEKIIVVDVDNNSRIATELSRQQITTLLPRRMIIRKRINIAVLHDAHPEPGGVAIIPRQPFHKIT